jgi:hypothetical protein
MRGSYVATSTGWPSLTFGFVALLAFAAPAAAQQSTLELPQPSPAARVEQQVGVTKFSIAYSSPGVKGRQIWGGLVPYEELWRTGANAATTLEASRDFNFGGKQVTAGSYALYTIPTKSTWTVILNKNPNAGGTRGYDKKNDVARVTVTPAQAPMRERLAFLFVDTTDSSTRLDLEWETLRVSVPITVDTKAQAAANIEKAVGDAWRPHFSSARYLLDNGGDLNQAMGYIDTSIGIKPTWWNNWVKAQILAKQGKRGEAVASAEQAQKLGKGDEVFEGFFKDQIAKAIADWKKA